MSSWLQHITDKCCAELARVAIRLQKIEEGFINANDDYYRAALETLAPNSGDQEQDASAFVAAVNIDINRSIYKIAGLGHVRSAIILFSNTIADSSKNHDGELVTIIQAHKADVSQAAFDKLITGVLKKQQLDTILRGETSILNDWSVAVRASEAGRTGQAWHDLADKIGSLLGKWATEIQHAYATFQKVLADYKYLSAHDLYYYINKMQGTKKPIDRKSVV